LKVIGRYLGPIPLSLFNHRLKTAFFISFKKPPPSRTRVQQLCNHGGSSDTPQSISIEAMGTNGLYGIIIITTTSSSSGLVSLTIIVAANFSQPKKSESSQSKRCKENAKFAVAVI